MNSSNLTSDQINWINTNESWDFDNADPVWKNTKSFAIQFMKSKERSVFSKLSDNLKNDGDVARTAILFDASDVLRNIPESLKDDRELILLALQKDGETICYLPDNLKFNRDLVLHALRQTFKATRVLETAPEELLKDSSFIDELCIILKDYTGSSDWKDVLSYIPFKVLDQTNEEFRSFFENLTRAGISNYKTEAAELIFDPNNPYDYKLSLEKIYSKNLPSNRGGWSSSFTIDGAFNYDSEGKIADWGSETLLYDTLSNDFFQNTWKPAMENVNLGQLIKMIRSTSEVGQGDFMKDNDVAIYGYNKVIEFIRQGEEINVEQLFDLLNAYEEYFVLEDEAPDVFEFLYNILKEKEKNEIITNIRFNDGYWLNQLFKESDRNDLVQWIDMKLTTETDTSMISDLEYAKEKMNEWEY